VIVLLRLVSELVVVRRFGQARHGLAAETVISGLEDAEGYKAFEAAVTADYNAQSAVERELVLRLASLLWRLRRATTMETGLFEIQAEQLRDYGQTRRLLPDSPDVIHALFSNASSPGLQSASHRSPNVSEIKSANSLAQCFLRLANLSNFALDRLSRYEATLWRQAGRILLALDALERRKPQERNRQVRINNHHERLIYDEY
jgi:hypothetical protein